jgi:hypothetical protein
MPPLSEIETELKRLGYGKADAESVYDFWLERGFKVGGRKIADWRASIRNMIRFNRLPSQRNAPPGLVEHRREKPAQLREAERDRRGAYGAMSDEERKRTAHALKKWRQDNL